MDIPNYTTKVVQALHESRRTDGISGRKKKKIKALIDPAA